MRLYFQMSAVKIAWTLEETSNGGGAVTKGASVHNGVKNGADNQNGVKNGSDVHTDSKNGTKNGSGIHTVAKNGTKNGVDVKCDDENEVKDVADVQNGANNVVKPFDVNDVVVVFWSSGTTGRPKGIMQAASYLVKFCLKADTIDI